MEETKMEINVDEEISTIDEQIAKLQEQKNMLISLKIAVISPSKTIAQSWYDICDTPMRHSDSLDEVAKSYFPWGEKYFRNCNTLDITVGNFKVLIPTSRACTINIEYLSTHYAEPKETKPYKHEELFKAYGNALETSSLDKMLDFRMKIYDNKQHRKHRIWYKYYLYFTRLYWDDKKANRDAKWYLEKSEYLKKSRLYDETRTKYLYETYINELNAFMESVLPRVKEFACDRYKVSSSQYQIKQILGK